MFHLFQRLIGRLSVGRKLILIYALDLSAVFFVSGILINEKFIAIDFARKEIIGNDYIAEVRQVLLPADPALSNRLLGQRLIEADDRNGVGLGSHELAEALAKRLQKLDDQHPSNSELAARWHTLALDAQALVTRVGNQSNLILDPDLDSYYTMSLVVLRFPDLFDIGRQIQEKVRLATQAPASERGRFQTEYLILEGRLDALSSGIASDYAEAFAAGTPQLKAQLEPTRAALLATIEKLRAAAREGALDNQRNAEIDIDSLHSSLADAWREAGQVLDQLLRARIDGLFNRMWLHLGTAFLLLLVILTVVFFVARQIVLPVRRLADVADKVRGTGNYELRATWQSADELGLLVRAFNGMLEQLNRSRMVEQELAASARAAEAQRELLEAIPIPLMVTAVPQHEVLHANVPAAAWLQGRDLDPWLTGLNGESRARFFQGLADTGAVDEFEAYWHSRDGGRWALISARRLQYQSQDSILTAFMPINRIKQMESRLELWAKVFEASSESILVTNERREILTANRAFCRTTAYDLADVIGKSPDFLQADQHPENFFADIWRTATERGSWQGEIWQRRKSGETFPSWVVLNAVRNERGTVTHYIAAALDISERKSHEQRISHLAQHDVLTDLPNRGLCVERLRLAVQQAARNKMRVGVLFIDLDRFKNINDSLGHHIGDGLLRSVSRRLLEAVRAGDTVSRLGGDEFMVVLNGVVDHEEISQIVDSRLIPLIRQPHDVDGAELHVSCSVGVAVFPDHGTDLDQLMRNADAAMYQAKFIGRNNAQFFTSDLDRRASERLSIEIDLRAAVDRKELQLFYQPRVEASSRRLLGVEALVRWPHAELGLISPARFIPIAEETGLIVPLGAWIFNEACRQQACWAKQGLADLSVSVNLSAVQLRDSKLPDMLRQVLAEQGANPAMIELELTESLLMEHVTSTIDLLHQLKALGVSLSVDDFGTGYSSLNYLHRFPIDKLKIDQSFVHDMMDDPNDLAITKAIIGLGHTLGLHVVAEGVETEEEAGVLRAAGCDELQGYLFARPMPAEEFEFWLAAYQPVTG